jgi:hypothetical protein
MPRLRSCPASPIRIFVNECNKEGRDEFPEACIDAEGVDRAALHRTIGEAAVGFFGTALRTSP